MTTFRATLRLERVEPYTADGGYARELCIELSSHTVTGDTPADAMTQLCAHADSLYEWHQQLADLASDAEPEPLPLLDEAVKPASGWMDQVLRDLYESTTKYKFEPAIGVFSALSHPGRHRCAVCGKPGPIKYEGNTWTCVDCNDVLEAKAEADLVDPRPAADGERRCLGGDPGRRCILVALHRGGCDPGNARRGFDATPNVAPRPPIESTDETHDAYGTPITPPFNPPPSSGDRFCQPCGDVFGPLHACFEDEPGQEGAEAENDPAFTDTETPSRKGM